MRNALLVAIMFACLSSSLSAQRIEDLSNGAQVRLVTTTGVDARGSIDAVTPEVIALKMLQYGQPDRTVQYRRDVVRTVEVFKKHSGKGALRGGALGLLIGGVGGLALGALTYSDSDCNILVCSRSGNAAFAGYLGAILGTPIGLIAGALRGMPEWQAVEVRPLQQ